MTKYWCAYTDYKFLPRFFALYESILVHCGDFRIYVLAFDDKAYGALSSLDYVYQVHYDDVITDDLEAVRPTRKPNEFIWTCTPRWIQFLLTELDLPEVYYIDADCFFYDYPGELYFECLHQNIAISPHRFPYRLKWREKANGLFNVGVEYFKNAPVTLECLARWHTQCLEWCYHASPGDGRCADQGYLNDWPERYNAHIITHLGVDLAPWNQEQFNYEWRDGKIWIEGIFPVIIYHFHSWSLEQDSDYPLHSLLAEHIYVPYREAVMRAQAHLDISSGA